jgi:cytochrome c-type biogenesis protein CcmF
MTEVGRFALGLAVLAGVGAVVLGVVGRAAVARLALVVAAVASALAVVLLGRALLANDFSWEYVADHSRRGASGGYRLAGLWGGMAGSLMFFAALLGGVGTVAAWRSRGLGARTSGLVAALVGGLVAALLGLVLAFADPFERLDLPAIEGRGLTPILEHPAMLYHPPLLYLGLVTLAAPFALALSAVVARVPGDEWGPVVRRWLVIPWTLLALGMVAGAHWAYVELGWGGYWAWDPVENTALLPWLAVTLSLHASLPGSGRTNRAFGGLVCLAFVLALAGTMLTRSGAVPSVHAFGEDVAVGRGLAVLLGVVAVGSLLVLAPDDRGRLRSSGARTLVVGHLAVVGAVLAVAVVGTAAPLVSELTGGDDIAVEGRYFAQFAGPLALVGLVLVALVPARRILPCAVGAGVGVAALWIGGGDLDLPRLALGAAAGAALGSAVAGGRRASNVAHAGLALLLLGVAGTATGTTESVPVDPGDTVEVGGETIRYEGVTVDDSSDPATVTATVHIAGRDLHPSLAAFPERRVLLPETSLISTPLRDVQVGLRGAADDGSATLQIGVYPLQVWVWWGALVLVAAGILLFRQNPPGDPGRNVVRRAVGVVNP